MTEYKPVLRCGEATASAIRRVRERLSCEHVSPAPLLVTDAVSAVCEPEFLSIPGNRPSAARLSAVLHRIRSASERVCRQLGASDDETKADIAFGLVHAWMSTAPACQLSWNQLERLEQRALASGGETAQNGLEEPPDQPEWRQWRRNEEVAMYEQGSPALGRALCNMESGIVGGFDCCDERAWRVDTRKSAGHIHLPSPSVQRLGDDSESRRIESGPFRELGAVSIPRDPSRLVPSDLALLASRERRLRALVAAKVGDGSLTARFGSRPFPSWRQPRVLILFALQDSIEDHQQRAGSVHAEIDLLREILLQTILFVTGELLKCQVELSIGLRRDGPLGSHALGEQAAVSNAGRPVRQLRSREELVGHIAGSAPWFFSDAFAESRPTEVSCKSFDSRYLVVAGRVPPRHYDANWTRTVSLSLRRGLWLGEGAPRPLRAAATRDPITAARVLGEAIVERASDDPSLESALGYQSQPQRHRT